MGMALVDTFYSTFLQQLVHSNLQLLLFQFLVENFMGVQVRWGYVSHFDIPQLTLTDIRQADPSIAEQNLPGKPYLQHIIVWKNPEIRQIALREQQNVVD